MTPLKAIRAKCLDCCCGSSNEVRLCPVSACPLYEYRDGHNPARKGLGNKNGVPSHGSTSDFSRRLEADE